MTGLIVDTEEALVVIIVLGIFVGIGNLPPEAAQSMLGESEAFHPAEICLSGASPLL